MAYQKRYEDSYLDEEEDDFDGAGFSDGARLVLLIKKTNLSQKEEVFLMKLTDRLTKTAMMPGTVGKEAIEGLVTSAEAYFDVGQKDMAIETWARLLDIAENIGNKDLYYKATDRMAEIG